MARHQLGLVALFALATNAFILPSTISVPELKGDGLEDIAEYLHDKNIDFDWPDMPDFESVELPHIDLSDIEMPDIHLPELRLPDLHLPGFLELTGSGITVPVPCPGCTMYTKESSTDDPNSIVFQLRIGEDGKELLLNGSPLYPVSNQPPLAYDVTQIANDDILSALDKSSEITRELYYAAGIATFDADDGTNNKLIDIWFHPKRLGAESIEVDPITIHVLESENGHLKITGLESLADKPNTHLPPTHTPFGSPDHECKAPEFLCNMMAYVEHKMSSLGHAIHGSHRRPCPDKMVHEKPSGFLHGPPPTKGGIPKFEHLRPFPEVLNIPPTSDFEVVGYEGHDHYHNHHHEEPYHHRLHAIAQAISSFILGFVVPVLIGILAGMAASLVGMVVGTSVAWLWIRFVRGGKRGPYARLPTQEEGVVALGEDEDIKIGEAPPVYVEKE